MIEQRSEEWYRQRLGKVTASRIADVVARTKTGYGASRANYMVELIIERFRMEAGDFTPSDNYVSPAMQWGIDHEQEAADAFFFATGLDLEPIGFVQHPTIEMSGASPDRKVRGENAIVEFKCPNSATHFDFLLTRTVQDKYVKQMRWQMACTGAERCYYVSYDPRMPTDMTLAFTMIKRDEPLIRELEAEVKTFLGELTAKMTAARARISPVKAQLVVSHEQMTESERLLSAG